VDVVPPDPVDRWHFDPWGGQIEGGRLYGRGSCDMKAGVVGMLMALACVRRAGIRLAGDVIIESVVDEERGGNGTLACALAGFRADGAVIPEPTELAICPISRGSNFFSLEVWGKAAHSASAWQGVSALERGCALMHSLHELSARRNARLKEKEPLFADHPLPVPLFIGRAQAGAVPNSLPEKCVMDGILAVGPDETIPEARREMEEWLSVVNDRDGTSSSSPTVLTWLPTKFEPAGIPAAHPLVTALAESWELTLGGDAPLRGFPSGCDQRHLIQYGSTPTVVFGPGSLLSAHTVDESVSLGEYSDYIKTIAVLIVHWCGQVA